MVESAIQRGRNSLKGKKGLSRLAVNLLKISKHLLTHGSHYTEHKFFAD